MSRPCRATWGIVAVLHGLAAVAWMLGMAQGFPADHPQFHTHLVLPGLVAVMALAAAAACLAGTPSAGALALVVPGVWLGGGAGLWLAWPVTGWPGLLLLGGAAAFASAWVRCAGAGPVPLAPAILAALAGLGAGLLFPALERAAPPSTRPTGGTPPSPAAASGAPVRVPLAPGVDLFPAESSVSLDLQLRGPHLEILPLLTFQSTSPDGGWTLFAPQWPEDPGPVRLASGPVTRAFYEGRHPATVEVTVGRDILLDSWTTLPAEVDSHLNTYTHLMLQGSALPRIAVAGLPPVAVEPPESPAVFAWLDRAREELVVARARTAEKGPFERLEAVAMRPGDPLEVALYDGDRRVAEIRWLDWSAQAGDALSPTAGWGVPVNALEWRADESGTAHLFLTLASTSMGRGWNAVAHAPGVYRNRMVIVRP